MKELKPLPLTAENFKDYGSVLSITKGEPMADKVEFKYWGKVSHLKMGQVVSSGVLFGYMRELIVKSMERHLNTPEVLIAIEGDSIICIGKPSSRCNEIEDIQAFYIKQGDAFAMHNGTWHCVPYPINSHMCKFLVMFASETEANDLEVRDLPEAVRVFV